MGTFFPYDPGGNVGGGCRADWGAVGLITPTFSIASGAAAYAYLIVGLIANAAIVAIFGLYVWSNNRPSPNKE